MSGGPEDVHEGDAAYVLGGLDPRERADYERHLEGCARCAASVAELAGLPGLLAALPPDEALALLSDAPGPASAPVPPVALAAAPELPSSSVPPSSSMPAQELVGARGRDRARPAARTLLAIAAGVVVVGAAGYALGGTADPTAPAALPPSAVAMSPAAGAPISADLVVSARSWGTRFDWTYRDERGAPPSGVYDLVAVSDDGARTVVATWRAVDGTAGGLVAASSLPTDSLAAVEILAAGSSTVLASADV